MHWEEAGAHTGEVSPPMLAGICDHVILGHSERRASGDLTEDDTAVNRKLLAAVAHALVPILCVGESLELREAGETHDYVGRQVATALDGLTESQAAGCVIAYEPIWAIGSGHPATPADANRTIGLSIRGSIAEHFGEAVAREIRVLYGGSVTADNIADFMAMPSIDGALVGGASLNESFVDLVRGAVGGGA
jgi:triosephosphate isomerase